MPSPTERLRADTRDLHIAVERAGIMPALLQGRLERPGYCRLLRNLQPIYDTLEPALLRRATDARLAPVVLPALFRTAALGEDLATLQGADWPQLPVMPATRSYVERLQQIDADAPSLLVAHAYVRYLGDLSGGRILRRIVADSLGIGPGAGMRFYDFGSDGNVDALTARLRHGIDAACAPAALDAIAAEAQLAFRLHQQLFEELAR